MFEDVSTWRAEISAALATSTGLDDPSRIDAIRSLEQLVCAATAAQAALAVELDRVPTRRAGGARRSRRAAGPRGGRPGRAGQAGVAPPRPTAPRPREGRGHRAAAHLGAWRAGRITEWKATLIARETACLSRDDRAAVDAAVAGDAPPSRADGRSRARPRLPAGGLPARPRVVRLPSPPGGGRPSRLAPAGARRDDVAERAAAGEGRRRGEGGAEPHGGDVRGPPATRGPGPSSRPTRWSTPCSRDCCAGASRARSSSAW